MSPIDSRCRTAALPAFEWQRRRRLRSRRGHNHIIEVGVVVDNVGSSSNVYERGTPLDIASDDAGKEDMDIDALFWSVCGTEP